MCADCIRCRSRGTQQPCTKVLLLIRGLYHDLHVTSFMSFELRNSYVVCAPVQFFRMISKFQVERYPYDPSLMVFMDYRDCFKEKFSHPEEANPTFLYAMAMSSTRVFFEVYMNFFSIFL